MSVPCRWLVLALCCFGLAWPVHASVGSVLVKSLAKHVGKQAGDEAAEKMMRSVGKEVIERTTEKLTREGGEQAVQEVGEMVVKHGPEVIRAVDNVPRPLPLIASLRSLPDDQVASAAARLAAGQSGRELADLTVRHGAKTLRAEVLHPGVGATFVRALGDDGAELSLRLTTDQATQIGRHVDDIASLPPVQRNQLLNLIGNKTDDFTSFLARFVEANPGKVLFTTAATGVVLTNAERILGGDEVVFDADGNPTVVSKLGIAGRVGTGATKLVAEPVNRFLNYVAIIVAAAIGLFAASKVWASVRKDHWRKDHSAPPADHNDSK